MQEYRPFGPNSLNGCLEPGYFMNRCREATKMGVPRAAQALAPRARQPYRGIGSEAYLKGTSQELTPEDARKDGHIRGRSHAKA